MTHFSLIGMIIKGNLIFKINFCTNNSENKEFIISEQNIFPRHNTTPIQTINNFLLNSNVFENILNDFIFIPEIKELPYKLMKLNKYGEFEFELDSHINSLNGTSISGKDWDYTTPDNSLNVE